MKTKICLFVTSVLIAASSVSAELRIWTDKKGNSTEAEFVRTTGDKVILRKADGTEIKIDIDALCEKDRRFAVLQAPPRIDISVNTDVDRTNKGFGNRGPGYQVQKESISAEVKIRKSSSAPYDAPLVAEVFLIGQLEQQDKYIILQRSRSAFSFNAENKNEHVYSTGEISLKQLEAGQQVGVEFRGYLAVVKDKAGHIVEMKTNKLDFQKHADAIMGSQRGDAFDENFTPLRRKPSRQEMKKQAEKKRRLPGRRF